MQAVTVQQERLRRLLVLQVSWSGMPASFISGKEGMFACFAYCSACGYTLFVLKSTTLAFLLAFDKCPQDDD